MFAAVNKFSIRLNQVSILILHTKFYMTINTHTLATGNESINIS